MKKTYLQRLESIPPTPTIPTNQPSHHVLRHSGNSLGPSWPQATRVIRSATLGLCVLVEHGQRNTKWTS